MDNAEIDLILMNSSITVAIIPLRLLATGANANLCADLQGNTFSSLSGSLPFAEAFAGAQIDLHESGNNVAVTRAGGTINTVAAGTCN